MLRSSRWLGATQNRAPPKAAAAAPWPMAEPTQVARAAIFRWGARPVDSRVPLVPSAEPSVVREAFYCCPAALPLCLPALQAEASQDPVEPRVEQPASQEALVPDSLVELRPREEILVQVEP